MADERATRSVGEALRVRRWPPRFAVLLAAAAAGAGAGSAVAWAAAPRLPDNDAVRSLASSLTGQVPEAVERAPDGEDTGGAGWARSLVSLRHYAAPPAVVARYPANDLSPLVSASQAPLVADRLRDDDWTRISIEADYPVVRAYRGGLRLTYAPVLGSPPSQPTQDARQPILGLSIELIRDDPAASVPLILIGAAIAGGAGLLGVARIQRHLAAASWSTRLRCALLGGAGIVLLAPATVTLYVLQLYVSAVDDTVFPEPAWLAYTYPATQIPALIGVILLLGAAIIRRPNLGRRPEQT